MNKLEKLFLGYAELEITGLSTERCLSRLAENGISFWEIHPISALSVQLRVLFRDREQAVILAEKSQCEANVLHCHPGIRSVLEFRHRPFFVLGILIAVWAVCICTDHVWFVTVSGNETVPTEKIVQSLEALGVRFGTRNDRIHSQEIKNKLLNSVDGLQWAAVNCIGGRCEVLVRERKPEPDITDRRIAADIVASRSGTITELRVMEGTPLCTEGDTVEQGQMLVTGEIPSVVSLRKARAKAEIQALTWHTSTVVTPDSALHFGEILDSHVFRAVQIGKLRINLWGNSRKCGTGCVRMISRKNMTLPGGFTFPVVWIEETCVHHTVIKQTISPDAAASLLCEYAARAVSAEMENGEILEKQEETTVQHGIIRLDGLYTCSERIGREKEVNVFGSE